MFEGGKAFMESQVSLGIGTLLYIISMFSFLKYSSQIVVNSRFTQITTTDSLVPQFMDV